MRQVSSLGSVTNCTERVSGRAHFISLTHARREREKERDREKIISVKIFRYTSPVKEIKRVCDEE